MKKITCPFCEDNFKSHDGLVSHIEDEHIEEIPKDFTVSQYLYYMRTGKTHGSCIVCKSDTTWNPVTNKYNRFCNKEKCKKIYRETFKKRMIGKYGKTTLLNDPDQQRAMLSHRKISGEYKWTDGTIKTYTGTYELEFLKVLDVVMGFDSSDVMVPSPHTYYYMYEGDKKFYIPDAYIPSLNLEIEIKQGGDNPNLKPNMVKIDKVKENLKDEVMKSQKDVNYIKIVDKKYENFIQYLFDEKEKYLKAKNVDLGQIIREASMDIEYLEKYAPVLESVANDKLYPIYIVLFSNNTEFGKVIRKVTGSEYTHAAISLDSTMNNMYSFSNIPYIKSLIKGCGFVRESLWSPMYRNNGFFTVMVTFVTKEEKKTIEDKIAYMKENFTKYEYNTLGLIEYYLKFKNTSNHDEKKKMKWFCSEFVANMLDVAHVSGFKNVLQSPQDIKDSCDPNKVFVLKDYTIDNFSEKELIYLTKEAENKFRSNQILHESMTEIYDVDDIVLEFDMKALFAAKKKEYDEYTIAMYTSFIDWKTLYREFKRLFKKTNVNVRFDLFELILRKYLIPLKKDVSRITEEIINEMNRIYQTICTNIIESIDVVSSTITYIGKTRHTLKYPNFVFVNESGIDIDKYDI